MRSHPPTLRPRRDPARPATREELCLLGPHQLSGLLETMAQLSPPGEEPDPGEIAQAWRDACDVYRELETREAGVADAPEITPFPPSLAEHQARLEALPALRHTFATVPVFFGLVALDRLVVSQYTLTRAIVDRLTASFARRPTLRQIAALCLPLAGGTAKFRLASRDANEFVFVSDAHDMRFLGARLVDAQCLAAQSLQGHAQAAVALGVGFSTNMLNAVCWRNRVVLNNGHHRAYALRALGVTHVPCILSVCRSDAELSEAATPEINEHADLYFDSPRPPLLRDFDHPRLTHRFVTPALEREVRLRIEVQSRLVAR